MDRAPKLLSYLNGNDAGADHRQHDSIQNVLRVRQATVEQAKRRNHLKYKRGAYEHPSIVSAVSRVDDRSCGGVSDRCGHRVEVMYRLSSLLFNERINHRFPPTASIAIISQSRLVQRRDAGQANLKLKSIIRCLS